MAPRKKVDESNHNFRALLIRHEQVLFAQAQQSVARNARHVVESRTCRWLLRTRDLTKSDDLLITQEHLAQMLGARRTSLSMVAPSRFSDPIRASRESGANPRRKLSMTSSLSPRPRR